MEGFLLVDSCRYLRVFLIQEKSLDYVGQKSVAIFDQSSLVECAKIAKIAKIG